MYSWQQRDLNYLVQTSSGARLDDTLVYRVILPLLPVLSLHLVLLGPHQEAGAEQDQAHQQIFVHCWNLATPLKYLVQY